MWFQRFNGAPRVKSRRSFVIAACSVIGAFIVLSSWLTPAVYANPGEWNSNASAFTFDDNTYSPAPNAPTVSGKTAFQWIDTSTNPDTAHVIYFDANRELQAQADGELITYDYANGQYSNSSPPTEVAMQNNLLGPEADNEQLGNTCQLGGGIGWILCPVSNYIAEAVDWVYTLIRDYLEVVPFTQSNSGVYQVWAAMRSIANLAFIIAFVVLIYSQITGAGLTNYGIKSMLPRLVLAAVLVNISFWVCAIAVDLSNIAGHSLQAILVNMRENLFTGAEIKWADLSTVILGGGVVAAGHLGFASAAGASFPALGFLLVSALISVAFAVLVAFVILAARQALIVILVLISPLAFVAYILPSTQSLFDRWRKTFMTLLMFFPIFALLFGGSQLAGTIVISSTLDDPEGGRLHIILIGLAIQMVPLVFTPLIIRFSTGLLGQIANFANNSQRGLLDRAKNWSNDKAEHHKNLKRQQVGRRHMNRPPAKTKFGRAARAAGRYVRPSNLAYNMHQNKLDRERAMRTGDDFMSSIADANYNSKINSAYTGRYAKYRQSHMLTEDRKDAADAQRTLLDSATEARIKQRYVSTSDDYFDRGRHDARLAAARSQTAADTYSARFERIVEEYKAGVNPYATRDENGELKLTESELRNLGGIAAIERQEANAEDWSSQLIRLRHEQSRKEMAEKAQNANLSSDLKESSESRTYAGGIDDNGATKVYARAIKAKSAEYMENVAAVGSLYSNEGYNAPDMLKIILGETTHLRDGTKVSDYHRDAAIQRITTEIGSNTSIQKVADYINSMGMRYDDTTKTYTDVSGQVLQPNEVESRRDLQQIFRESYNRGSVKVSTISQADLSAMESGTYAPPTQEITTVRGEKRSMLQSEYALVRDMKFSNKFSQDRWITEDADVLKRYVQILREDSIRTMVPEDLRQSYAQQIQSALTNPLNVGKIKDREAQLLQIVQKYLAADKSTLDRNEKETLESTYVQRNPGPDGRIRETLRPTTQKVSTFYQPDEFNDSPQTGPI